MRRSRLGFARANSLRPAPLLQLLFAGSLALGAGTLGYDLRQARNTIGPVLADSTPSTPETAATAVQQAAEDTSSYLRPVQILEDARNTIVAAVSPKPETMTREVELDDGQNFDELLSQSGANQADATAAMNALSKVYDLDKLQAGQDVTLNFLRTDQQENFNGATFTPEATKEITVVRNADGTFTANVAQIPVVRQRLAAKVEIRTSLRDAAEKAGIPHSIIASMIRVYSHTIDFQRDIHPGDTMEILYDQPMTKYGKAVGDGSIIYAAMQINGKMKPVYRVTFSDGTVDYFDGSGHSTRRALLRTPVAAAHITSGFGMRMHPILGYSKMHKGVDFGASIGTPIFAAGNGTIDDIGFKGGYGRYIRIRHDGHLSTAYAHMSRFASSLYRGAHVNQGQVIGYVGASGRATGPHLHYETIINGQQVNPMSVSNQATGRVLEGKILAQFREGESHVQQEFMTLLSKSASTQRPTVPTAANAPAHQQSMAEPKAEANKG